MGPPSLLVVKSSLAQVADWRLSAGNGWIQIPIWSLSDCKFLCHSCTHFFFTFLFYGTETNSKEACSVPEGIWFHKPQEGAFVENVHPMTPHTPAEIERHNSHFIAGCRVWERLIGIEYERDRNPVYSRMGVRTIPKLWLAFNNGETKFDLAVWTRISWEFCGRLDSCKELLIALGAHQWNSDGSDKLTLNLTNH